MKLFTFLLTLMIPVAAFSQNNWKDIAVIDELEIYVDTLKIEKKGNFLQAQVKTVYMTKDTKSAYVNKIRQSYPKQDNKLDKKMKKWDDFSYNISTRIYDCSNKQYMTTEITDYSSNGKKIIKTKTSKKNQQWAKVGIDTMGDYTLYFICDYNSL